MVGLTQVGWLIANRDATNLQKHQVCPAIIVHKPYALRACYIATQPRAHNISSTSA